MLATEGLYYSSEDNNQAVIMLCTIVCTRLKVSDSISTAFNGLFKRIYEQSAVPSQWLVSKTIPVFKNKGDRKDIENYIPISNLCSCSKIVEKLILNRILDLQVEHYVDLTGTNQHGFIEVSFQMTFYM